MSNIARTTIGNVIPAVQAMNQMQGDREVSLVFTEGNVADINNLVILPSLVTAILKTFSTTPNTNVTVSSPDNFTSNFYANYYAQFALQMYSINNIRISTNDTANLEGTLIYTKTQIDGQVQYVRKPLRDLRVNVGNGYSDTVSVPNWMIVKDLKSELTLSKLKRNTAVTVTFTVDAVADAGTFTAIGSQMIQ